MKEESLLLLSDLQKLINQVVLIDYTIIILGGVSMIDKPSLSIEDYEICNKLKSMRFSGMAEALEEVLADPNAELLPFREKIQRIVDAEWNLRYTKKLNRFIKKATLKYPAADLDDTIYHPERQLDTHIIEELSKCEWIEQGKNLVITGKTSSGKSYLANALCICALRQFKTARYIKASQLINDYPRLKSWTTIRKSCQSMPDMICLLLMTLD